MTAQERRAAIVEVLSRSHQPVSAGALARRFGVSRQLIVGDVALLRAGGEAVTATARGYTLQPRPQGLVRRVACRHEAADMERELEIMVDNGCTVLDVMVDHPVYGQLTGALRLSSRYDVRQFIQRAGAAQPLSLLTEGRSWPGRAFCWSYRSPAGLAAMVRRFHRDLRREEASRPAGE